MGTLVVGILLTASKVRPLVIGGVVLVLICFFILLRMVVDRDPHPALTPHRGRGPDPAVTPT